MKSDERGLTLIEILITLAILSFVGVIIWNVFFQGYKFSQKSISKNFMIQETNLLITNLTSIHQKYNQYEIRSTNSSTGSPCIVTVTPNKEPKQDFSNSQICFNYVLKIDNVDKGSGPIIIEPNKKDVTLIVTATDIKNPINKITIETLLYRVKGVDYQ
ncbi:type II secretion system protein [Neobacillus sp. NPDC058068]|uniref:type II secretion system protein n=1 Tax=Neobacillus sp. NPDC058068 TaxID=3346325 RepID=UPI0036D83DEE